MCSIMALMLTAYISIAYAGYELGGGGSGGLGGLDTVYSCCLGPF